MRPSRFFERAAGAGTLGVCPQKPSVITVVRPAGAAFRRRLRGFVHRFGAAGARRQLGGLRLAGAGLGHEPVVGVGQKPLVMITTNEERSLPDAFLRRCLSLHLHFPENRDEQKTFLVKRAEQNAKHFPLLDAKVFAEAADMLVDDRDYAQGENLYPLPGQAEYLDMLRALSVLGKTSDEQEAMLNQINKFVLRKYPVMYGR